MNLFDALNIVVELRVTYRDRFLVIDGGNYYVFQKGKGRRPNSSLVLMSTNEHDAVAELLKGR